MICACGQPAALLCDGRVITLQDGSLHRFGKFNSNVPRKTTSCDAPICKDCRIKVSDIHLRTKRGGRWDTIDLCPLCAAASKESI